MRQPVFRCVECGKQGHFESNLCGDCKPAALEKAKKAMLDANPKNQSLVDRLSFPKTKKTVLRVVK